MTAQQKTPRWKTPHWMRLHDLGYEVVSKGKSTRPSLFPNGTAHKLAKDLREKDGIPAQAVWANPPEGDAWMIMYRRKKS